jgi:hypothetical protein
MNKVIRTHVLTCSVYAVAALHDYDLYLYIYIYYIILFIPLSLRAEHRVSTVPRHPMLLFQFLGSIRYLVGILGGGISPA